MGEFFFKLGVKRVLVIRTPNPDTIKQMIVKSDYIATTKNLMHVQNYHKEIKRYHKETIQKSKDNWQKRRNNWNQYNR